MLGWLLIAFAVVVVVGILIAASRSAKRGKRYIGTGDPIEAYEDAADGAWSFPWGQYFRVGAFNYGSWRQRVRLQARLDAERHAEEAQRQRARYKRHEHDQEAPSDTGRQE